MGNEPTLFSALARWLSWLMLALVSSVRFMLSYHTVIASLLQIDAILIKYSFILSFFERAIPGLFFIYFCLFYKQLTQIKFENFCRCRDSICGSLVLEATALPTAPQPWPSFILSYSSWSFVYLTGLNRAVVPSFKLM